MLFYFIVFAGPVAAVFSYFHAQGTSAEYCYQNPSTAERGWLFDIVSGRWGSPFGLACVPIMVGTSSSPFLQGHLNVKVKLVC